MRSYDFTIVLKDIGQNSSREIKPHLTLVKVDFNIRSAMEIIVIQCLDQLEFGIFKTGSY